MGFYAFILFGTFVAFMIYRYRHGEAGEEAIDRFLSQIAKNLRNTWPVLVLIVGTTLGSAFVMFFVPAPELVKIIAVFTFAGSGVALMAWATYVFLKGLYR